MTYPEPDHLREVDHGRVDLLPALAARALIAEDPVARGGFARAELRPYQPGFLRGRD